jgi:hypothetical protein
MREIKRCRILLPLFSRLTQKQTYIHISIIIFALHTFVISQVQQPDKENKESEYRIEKPGTITFTVGVKIIGKVEKPQVMIFLPKEKSIYKTNDLTRSFSSELNEPLPFTPLLELN